MVVVIDYGMGNIGSILNMIKKVGGRALCSNKKEDIINAEKLILPGVGAFDNGIRNLNEIGLRACLDEKVLLMKTPVLGICLGMQLMTQKSEEGILNGLGWISGEVVKFTVDANDNLLKVPHMGWNYINKLKEDKLFENLYCEPRFYFVHSYHVKCYNYEDILCTSNYGIEFVSAFRKDNIIGFQFHPEKSHKYGLTLIKNFLEM